MILGIYGSGGLGRGTKEIAELQGKWEKIIFIDDTVSADIYKGIERMPFEQYRNLYNSQISKVVIAIGEPDYRRAIYNKVKSFGYSFANVIHPTVYVSPDAILGEGIIAQMGAMIAVDATVDNNVTLEQYSVIAHDAIVKAHSHISAFVMIAGRCKIGEGTFVGINSALRENIEVGRNTIISMGSIVQKSVPDNVIVMGNPARIIRNNENQKVFNKVE